MIQTMLMEFDEDTAIVHLNKEYDTPKERERIEEICTRYGFGVVFKEGSTD